MTSAGKERELSNAKRVVTATMKLKMAKLLFNQPVDPETLGLPNYFDVVKEPMDLGTILDRLSAGEQQGWKKCEYQKAEEVYRDVSLVWHNCALYNSREVDKPTREAAVDVKAVFEQNWKEAGLSNVSEKPAEPRETVDFLPESTVPQSVGIAQEGLSVPLRVLDGYKILQVSTGKAADLVQAWSTPLTAQGETIALDSKSKKQKHTAHISTGAILDWCFTYGAKPSLFIVTELAWYKLTTPAGDYAQFQQQMQQRLDLCTTAVKLLKGNSSLTPLAAAEAAYNEAIRGRNQEEEQEPIVSFVQAQVSAWMEATATGGAGKKKAETKLMSGIRLGKAGLAVSGKTAAKAAVEAANQTSLVSAGKKRKTKPAATSLEHAQKKCKKRKVEGANAEDVPPDEAKNEQARSAGTRKNRPPRPPIDGASTPAEGRKLGSTSEAKRSRLGKEAKAAGRDTKGSTDRAVSAPAYSEAGSGEDLDGDNQDDSADPNKAERVSGRRTRQASVQLEPAWLQLEELEETPSKHKSKRKNKGKASAAAKVKADEQAKRESYDAGRSRMKREKEEHAGRGPIPAPCRDFRLPQRQVPALLMIWELTQALGSLMQLAPCPFWRLEAAIAPGPRLSPDESASKDETAAADTSDLVNDNAESQQQDADEATEHAANNTMSEEKPQASKKPRGSMQAPPKQADTGIDSAGSASTVVLREVHCALLRIIQGQGMEKDISKGQPTTAKLFSPDSSGPVPWTAQVAQAILAAPGVGAVATAKGAALKLAYMEYADLQLEERLALLQALLEQALDCEVVRDLITSKVEAMALPRQKKPGKEAGTPGPAKEGTPNPKELEVTAQPGSCEEWLGWMEACRVGWRKPLGHDMQRHRYWALGASTGCWRVYVEEQEGALWGWYEGEGIMNLVEWLKAASIEREAGLLKALSQVPLPKKVPTEGHPSKHTISTSSEKAGELLSSSELEARRPDGFKFITAPVLRGEGNWPSISLYAPLEQRIHVTVDALLARIPFWLKGETWLARHAHVLQAVEKARSGGDVAKALLFVERMLVEQHMMQPHWEQHFQAPWRQSLAKCSDSRQAILYLAALQEHMVVNSDVLPRHGFTQMVRNMRCQLYFPFPTEQVVLLRTGVLVHINAYMRSLGLTPPAADQAAAPPAKPQPTHADSHAAAAGPSFLKAQIASAGSAGLRDHGPMHSNGVAHTNAMDVDLPGGKNPDSGLQEANHGQVKEGQQDMRHTGAGMAGASASDWLGPIKPDNKEQLRQVWEHLKETVEALPHVGCYSIASVAYRRSLVETLPEDEEAVLSGQQARRPVAWLLLRPARGPGQQRQPQRAIALPISCDASLPDYMVKADVFEKGMRRHWHKQDRFRMFFASSYTNKTGGGVYYKGTVTQVRQQMPAGGINLQGRQDYDPWEALEVEWDVGGDAEGMDHISPWEIENDPEEERRLLEDQRKAQEAAARTARLEAKAAKTRRVAEGLYTDEEDEAEASPAASAAYSHSSDTDAHEPHRPPTQPQPTPQVGQRLPEPQRQDAADLEREIAQALAADAAFLEDPSMTLREGALQPLEAGQEEGAYELPALSAGGTISKDVLDMVRGLDKDSFTCLLINWYRRAKGKYKVPTFAHQELDLHKVFWEVQDKGGYDQVTNFKLWKEICRSLDLDLRGQTSASYNMRLNYEKCLLEFERYLAFGQYNADLAGGTAPPTHHLEAPLAVKPTQGTEFVAGVAVPMQGVRSSARLAAAGPNPFSATDELDELSFTELLNMDLEADDAHVAPVPASSSQQQQAPPLPGVSSVTRPRSRRGGPGTAPKGSRPPQHSAAVSSQAGQAVVVASGGGPSMGALLQGLGRRLAGKKVMRHWPDNGGWWEADVDTYNASSGQHRLSYDEGEDEESFEWVDFRELTDDEVRQHPCYIVVQPRPPHHPAHAPSASAAAKPAPKPGSSNTEQAAMSAIMAALRSGIGPDVVHSMVDVAAAALHVTAPAPSPSSPTCNRTLPANTLHPPANHPSHASPTRPSVSSPKQPHSQAKKGPQSGLKSVLKTAAGTEPAERNTADRAASDAVACVEAPAMVDAPYSFRRHRRMDLQPQPAAVAPQPLSQPASQPSTAAPRIKRKHQSSEAEAAAEAAAAEAAEPVLPVRTSVRVKLRRSGSAGKQHASSSALSGKQLSEAHGKRRHKHRHRSQALPEEEAGVESLTSRGQHTEAIEGGGTGSRMQSSSGPGYSQELAASHSRWQSATGDEQAEAVDEEHSSESGQAGANAASGHSKSEEHEDADQAAAALDTEAATGSHAEHAAPTLSQGHRHSPAGGEQAAGQSHVTGAPHSQAQQGGFQMPQDTAGSDLNQHEHLRALSMTESNAGADLVVHDQAEPTFHDDGVPSTQACHMGVSDNGQAALDHDEQHSMPAAAKQNGQNSDKQGWLHSSSVEVASPQQPIQHTGTDGSKSVDQMLPQSKGTAEGHGADSDRAESQLRAARHLKQPD